MEYQAAKSELQAPPHQVPLFALALEAATVVGVALFLAWWI